MEAWRVILAWGAFALFHSVTVSEPFTSRKPDDLPAFCRTIRLALSGAKE